MVLQQFGKPAMQWIGVLQKLHLIWLKCTDTKDMDKQSLQKPVTPHQKFSKSSITNERKPAKMLRV